MAPPHAKGASRSVRFSNTRDYASHSEQSSSDSWDRIDESPQHDADLKLRPLKGSSSPSSSKSNDRNLPIQVPDDERDTSRRIKELLAAEDLYLPDTFDTDLEDGDSSRSSLALSDDYGVQSDKGLLPKHGHSDDEGKRFHWKSLFRLHSWWNVSGLLIIAIVVVWFSIWGFPWSSTEKAARGFVGAFGVSQSGSLTVLGNGTVVSYAPRWNEQGMAGKLCEGARDG